MSGETPKAQQLQKSDHTLILTAMILVILAGLFVYSVEAIRTGLTDTELVMFVMGVVATLATLAFKWYFESRNGSNLP